MNGDATKFKTLFVPFGVLVVLATLLSGCGFRTKLPLPGHEEMKAAGQKAEIASTRVVDAFIKKLVERDVTGAYDLFSTRAKGQYKVADVQKLIEGDNYAIVSGYENLEVKDSGYGSHVDLDTQFTFITLTGVLTYTGEFTGKFDANLEEDNGEWRLNSIKLLAPPEKEIIVDTAQEESLAMAKLVELRSRWNAKDFATIFEEGGPKFRVESQKSQIISGMQQAFDQYGNFERVIDSKIKVVINTPLQVRMAFHTQFQGAELSERFTFVKIDGQYKLGGYNINAKEANLDDLLGDNY